jgi:hypothetical protein
MQWDYTIISKDQLDAYFAPLDSKSPELDTQLKENPIYPVKDYYRKYPDSVRFYLNEESMIETR